MTRHPSRALCAAALVLLAACSGTTATLSGLVASPVGQSLVVALVDNLMPGVDQAIANAGAKVAGSKDAQMVAFALPWAQQAIDYFAPALGVPAAELAKIDAGVKSAEALLAAPPSDLSGAIAAAAGIYQEIVADLRPALQPAPAS